MCIVGSGCIAASCPDWVIALAILGATLIYSLIGILAFTIAKKEFNVDDDFTLALMGVIWPFVLAGGLIYLVGYWIIMWLIFPFIGATKQDLSRAERRLLDKIETQYVVPNRSIQRANRNVTVPIVSSKFKVGDYVTGVKGNPEGYQHINEGCVCRISKVLDNLRYEVILLDHYDFNNQKQYLGRTFTVPERAICKSAVKSKKARQR